MPNFESFHGLFRVWTKSKCEITEPWGFIYFWIIGLLEIIHTKFQCQVPSQAVTVGCQSFLKIKKKILIKKIKLLFDFWVPAGEMIIHTKFQVISWIISHIDEVKIRNH